MADVSTLRSLSDIHTINKDVEIVFLGIYIVGVEIQSKCEREAKYKSVHEYSRTTGKNSELVYRTRKNQSFQHTPVVTY